MSDSLLVGVIRFEMFEVGKRDVQLHKKKNLLLYLS